MPLYSSSFPLIEGDNKIIFEKLRTLEIFYISTILNIEGIRIRILNKKPDETASFLLSHMQDNNIFIINKQHQQKIKKERLIKLLQNGELQKALDIVHFPSKLILEIGEKVLDKEDIECLREITKDEKKAVEIITAMHYPMVLDIVSLKIKNNNFFIRYENDLINEGFLGILEAVYKFDLSKKNKFITYAIPWVKYRINSFVKKLLKDIDSRNGNHRAHIFKEKIFESDFYINDFKEKIYDYDSSLPLAYLFPKLNFLELSTLKSNLNMVLNNHSYVKRLINYCKENNSSFADIIVEHSNKPEVAARLIMERVFPYMVKMKTFADNTEAEFKNNQFYSLKEDSPDEIHEKEDMIETVLREANEEEKKKIKMFLNEEITFKSVEPILKKIKKRLESKGYL